MEKKTTNKKTILYEKNNFSFISNERDDFL